jgi:hypothetical protein
MLQSNLDTLLFCSKLLCRKLLQVFKYGPWLWHFSHWGKKTCFFILTVFSGRPLLRETAGRQSSDKCLFRRSSVFFVDESILGPYSETCSMKLTK